jgi:hypothetical protein
MASHPFADHALFFITVGEDPNWTRNTQFRHEEYESEGEGEDMDIDTVGHDEQCDCLSDSTVDNDAVPDTFLPFFDLPPVRRRVPDEDTRMDTVVERPDLTQERLYRHDRGQMIRTYPPRPPNDSYTVLGSVNCMRTKVVNTPLGPAPATAANARQFYLDLKALLEAPWAHTWDFKAKEVQHVSRMALLALQITEVKRVLAMPDDLCRLATALFVPASETDLIMVRKVGRADVAYRFDDGPQMLRKTLAAWASLAGADFESTDSIVLHRYETLGTMQNLLKELNIYAKYSDIQDGPLSRGAQAALYRECIAVMTPRIAELRAEGGPGAHHGWLIDAPETLSYLFDSRKEAFTIM